MNNTIYFCNSVILVEAAGIEPASARFSVPFIKEINSIQVPHSVPQALISSGLFFKSWSVISLQTHMYTNLLQVQVHLRQLDIVLSLRFRLYVLDSRHESRNLLDRRQTVNMLHKYSRVVSFFALFKRAEREFRLFILTKINMKVKNYFLFSSIKTF